MRYGDKQSICCRMRGSVCPIPQWTLALRTALPRSAPQSRTCPLTTRSQLRHPQTGKKAAAVNPRRWSDPTGWGGGSLAVPCIIPVCNLGNPFFGSFLFPQLKRRPLEGRGDAQAGLSSAFDESCRQSRSRGAAAPRPPPSPGERENGHCGAMCGLRGIARGLPGDCSGSPCSSAAGKVLLPPPLPPRPVLLENAKEAEERRGTARSSPSRGGGTPRPEPPGGAQPAARGHR